MDVQKCCALDCLHVMNSVRVSLRIKYWGGGHSLRYIPSGRVEGRDTRCLLTWLAPSEGTGLWDNLDIIEQSPSGDLAVI